METAYKFNENSPVITFRNGGFGFNYKNAVAAKNFINNLRSCKDFDKQNTSDKKEEKK